VLGISTHKKEKAEETGRPVEKTGGHKEETDKGEGKPAGH